MSDQTDSSGKRELTFSSINKDPLPACSDGNKALTPLIQQISAYDALRVNLEKAGGKLNDLRRITEILKQEFSVIGRYNSHRVSLINHASIYSMLYDIGDCDIRLSIRQLDTGMPVYYLCRTHRDYWADYSLIVQDIYRSPGYPMIDGRFVKLMLAGHEVYYLRLSDFRKAVTAIVEKREKDGGHEKSEEYLYKILSNKYGVSPDWSLRKDEDGVTETVDNILYNVGRHVFQSAWHEDQRLGVLVAAHFGLKNFCHCIELLYLCLSAELCELRIAVDEVMLEFFDKVYPQTAIRGFLELLTTLDGDMLTTISQGALELYARLSTAFSRFLETQVEWASCKVKIPLYKLVYGNLSRLDFIEEGLRGSDEVKKCVECLEKEAQVIIEKLMRCG